MIYGLVSSAIAGLVGISSTRYLHRTTWCLPVLALLFTVGPRIEILGLGLGLFVLSLDLPNRGVTPFLQGLVAALIAVLFGFRIHFFTNPAGGYIYLNWISLPLTVVWVLIIMRSREELARLLPRPALQLAFDAILVVNAILLTVISPQTRLEPIAIHLPFALLGILLVTAVAVYQGHRGLLIKLHRTVAFCLALYGISGVMKTPISLSLLAPLAIITLPIMTTSYGLIAQGSARARVRPLPLWLVARGYTQGEVAFLLLVLSSALTIGAVLGVHLSPVYGFLTAGVIPFLFAVHFLRKPVSNGLAKRWVTKQGSRRLVFGIGFNNLALDEALYRLEKMLLVPRRPHVIVTPDSVALLRARKNHILRQAYLSADLIAPDGVGIIWATRLLGLPLKERVTGIDLTTGLLELATRKGYRIFLLGGREGVAGRARDRIKERFPSLAIVGAQHGYFDDDETIIRTITQATPDILLVGMGAPKQELWMAKHKDRLHVPLMLGVGGALDVFAGNCRRAPIHWQRMGLEWLYRLLRQPYRIKSAITIPIFIARVLVARLVLDLFTFISISEENG